MTPANASAPAGRAAGEAAGDRGDVALRPVRAYREDREPRSDPPGAAEDRLAVEEPLEIRIDGRPLTVVMRTPGHDRDLAAGLLLSEGIVTGLEQIASISRHSDTARPLETDALARQPETARSPEADAAPRHPETPRLSGKSADSTGVGRRHEGNVIDVRLTPGVEVDWKRLDRSFFSSASCGLCGKSTIAAVRTATRRLRDGTAPVPEEAIYELPGKLLASQGVFAATGGLHACGLFDGTGTLLHAREDIGRHNAVDKVIGAALLAGSMPLDRHLMMVSGRASFEIVQKAAAAGVPVLCAVSAPSSLAVDLADELNLTLVGFLRDRTFNLYTAPHRIAGARGASGSG